MFSLLGRTGVPVPERIYVNFNQKASSLAVAAAKGCRVHNLGRVDTELEPHFNPTTTEVYLLERLFTTSLVALVTRRYPNKLRIWNILKDVELCNYTYSTPILGLKLNRDRLVVCLESTLYILNIIDMMTIHTILETPRNASGLIALAPSRANSYLAYPGHQSMGVVNIFDALNLQAKMVIKAFETPLGALSFNSDGTAIATASDRGTIIRVFSTDTGLTHFNLLRGMRRYVTICSLEFSMCQEYLIACSNTETVHIFYLHESIAVNPDDPAGHAVIQETINENWVKCLGNAVASYLPTQLTEVLGYARAFAKVTMSSAGIRRVCAMTTIGRELRLMIATEDGFLYTYAMAREGGTCMLKKRYDIRPLDLGDYMFV